MGDGSLLYSVACNDNGHDQVDVETTGSVAESFYLKLNHTSDDRVQIGGQGAECKWHTRNRPLMFAASNAASNVGPPTLSQ